MHSVVGVFLSRTRAEKAVADLRASGVSGTRINLLTPGASERELAAVPVTETEQPGMGKAVGGVVGGAVGAAGGMQLGTAVASILFLPGVGPVLAFGAVAAALLGVAGIVGGAAAGEALEQSTMEGLPKDELFLYEDALRQGRSVVIVLAEDDQAAETARGILARAGAESLDAARENWWLGIRDAEAEHYVAHGHDFRSDEPTFRRGFEAALHHGTQGKDYADVVEDLRKRFPDVYADEAFRRGFERGRAYFWVFKDRQPH